MKKDLINMIHQGSALASVIADVAEEAVCSAENMEKLMSLAYLLEDLMKEIRITVDQQYLLSE